jgi:type II secretory pathway pseudopilin PulG
MTLVELLVALTLLGLMSALASVTWSSLRRWDASAQAAETALRPQRVVMMLERQWASRAALAEGDETLGRLETEPLALRFATRRPALDPAWPTAEASYTIDRSDPAAQRLLYAETRLGPLGEKLTSEAGSPITLLDGAREIQLRYRIEREPEDGEPAETLWTTDPAALTLRETRLLAVELTATLDNGEGVEWIGIVEPSR